MQNISGNNPITLRIDQMCASWNESVDDSTTFIRWLIQPDELRMIDAFCMMESSSYGQLPDLFNRFMILNTSEGDYDTRLLISWIETWERPESRTELEKSGISCKWDPQPWKNKLEKGKNVLFLDCMSDFINSIKGFEEKLVIYVNPANSNTEDQWVDWVNKNTERGIPERLRLMIADVIGSELFENLRGIKNSAHLIANLNMNQAAREIATSGNPNDPGVQFNTCILNMGECLSKNNPEGVDQWGLKAIETGRSGKMYNLEAAAGIAYGAALFQLRKMDVAIDQLLQARKTGYIGMEKGNKDCGAVVLQSYSFEGAIYMHQKKFSKAIEIYAEMAGKSLEQGNVHMASDGWYLAHLAAKRNNRKDEAYKFLQKGFHTANSVDEEQKKYSHILVIGNALFLEARDKGDNEISLDVDKKLKAVWGDNWQNLVAEQSKNHHQMYSQDIFNISEESDE